MPRFDVTDCMLCETKNYMYDPQTRDSGRDNSFDSSSQAQKKVINLNWMVYRLWKHNKLESYNDFVKKK